MRSDSVDINGRKFSLSPDRVEFLSELQTKYPNQTVFTKEDIDNVGHMPYWVRSKKYPFRNDDATQFDLTALLSNVIPMPTQKAAVKVSAHKPSNMPVAAQTESINILEDDVKIVPEKMSNYVPFGHFKDVENIIKSKIFFPVFVMW